MKNNQIKTTTTKGKVTVEAALRRMAKSMPLEIKQLKIKPKKDSVSDDDNSSS